VKVKWSKIVDGVYESKCGRFDIVKDSCVNTGVAIYSVRDYEREVRAETFKLASAKAWAQEQADQEWPKVFYTFSKPHGGRDIYIKSEPSSFNGAVDVTRYRITVERIDEPEEEKERLRKLWVECDNNHQWAALDAAAARLGIALDVKDRGSDRKRYR